MCVCSHDMPQYESLLDGALIYFNKEADRLTWHRYAVARSSSKCAQTLNASSLGKSLVTAVDFSKCFLYQWHPQLLPLGLHTGSNQQHPLYSLRCFDAVGWAAGRASGLQNTVLAWLSVWSEVQMTCMWSS